MQAFLLQLHSGVRWLVMLITVVALVKLALGIVQKQSYDKLTQRIMLAFSGLISLQWLLGIILLIAMGTFSSGQIWSHAGTMTVAVAVSHLHNRWKKAEDPVRYRMSLVIVIAVLVLVVIGVTVVNGWQ
ncbi:MAG: hypothetical protein H0X30_37425 [Anaerolineae bacterium]|nr:hypothetical protein [Anaerolineae bacterium]